MNMPSLFFQGVLIPCWNVYELQVKFTLLFMFQFHSRDSWLFLKNDLVIIFSNLFFVILIFYEQFYVLFKLLNIFIAFLLNFELLGMLTATYFLLITRLQKNTYGISPFSHKCGLNHNEIHNYITLQHTNKLWWEMK